jgi:hypothetical protein
MAALHPFPDGGYSFLEGGFPYSQGVVALKGYAIERVRFRAPVPLMKGFGLIADFLKKEKRPKTALCAAELRSPKPFSFAGFAEFNKGYVAVLEKWGIFRDGLNPVARSNVAPEFHPPREPVFYAFCYTVPARKDGGGFVIAGSGEWPEGGRFPEDIVARGDTSEPGMRLKADFVVGKMEARLAGLRCRWSQATVTQLYTVYGLGREMLTIQRAIQPSSLTWHYCRPPIEGLDYEMDVRGVRLERVL